MKILLFLLTFVILCPFKLLCQRTNDGKTFGRQPAPNTLQLKNKEREIWSKKKLFISANFQQSRNIGSVQGTDFLRRTSSYTFPVLLGLQLREKWSAEAGPFVGINREAYQQSTMIQSEPPMQATLSPSFGLMLGVSRQLVDQLSLQLRIRRDFGGSQQAWEPVQLGWNLRF